MPKRTWEMAAKVVQKYKKKENEGAIKDSELSKIPYLCSQIKLLIYVVAKNCKKNM